MALELPQDMTELAELISQASTLYNQLQQAAQTEKAEAKVAVESAIINLEALLGPVDAVPSLDSIRGVLAHGDQAISENPGTAVVLLVHGMATLVENQISLAKALR